MLRYLLTKENCNGDYCETVHHSIHETSELAKKTHGLLQDPEELKGQDARNKWEPYPYRDNPGQEEFRTGNWGYVCWKITPIECYVVELTPEQVLIEKLRIQKEESDPLTYTEPVR